MSKSRAECLRILGLPSTASDKEIKDAYRKKALELHPDKNPEDREAATKRFQEVQEAYTSLVKEDDDEEIPEWLRMIIIMRERERRRRQFEQFMFGFGGMFNPFAFGFHDPDYYDEDDDDEYEYYQDIFGNIYRRKRRPRRRYNHDHWRSDDFEHYSNNTSSSRPKQYPGSAETNKNSSPGHEANVDSPNPSPEWLPKQPKQPTTRSAKQKKKKKGKKNKNKKKRGHTSVRNVKEMKNNCAGQDSDSDEESVSSTIDSMDSYYNSEELEEEEEDDDDGVSKNTQDNEKKENDYETNDNLSPEKLGNKERKNNSREDLAFENECFTTENGCKINSRTEKTDQEKGKVEDTGVGGNMCNDNTSDPSQGDNNVKFENKENDTRTSKKTCQKNFSAKGEYRGTHKIIDESIFKETTNTFCKKETDEEDWSNWTFPKHVNSTDIKKEAEDATKTTHQGKGKEEAKPNKGRNGDELLNTGKRGKENVPKTTDNGQGREEVTPSSNGEKGGDKERSGKEDPNLTNKEKAGKVPQSTNKGRDGKEASKPSELGKKKVPKGTFGCQNGQTRPSDEGFQYEIIKKRYGGYIKKHSDPGLTGRIKKLIDITTQDN